MVDFAKAYQKLFFDPDPSISLKAAQVSADPALEAES